MEGSSSCTAGAGAVFAGEVEGPAAAFAGAGTAGATGRAAAVVPLASETALELVLDAAALPAAALGFSSFLPAAPEAAAAVLAGWDGPGSGSNGLVRTCLTATGLLAAPEPTAGLKNSFNQRNTHEEEYVWPLMIKARSLACTQPWSSLWLGGSFELGVHVQLLSGRQSRYD